MKMQKAGLLTALALTVVVAVTAYPKSDRGGTAARIANIGTERDSAQPTPLDKLKAAARVGVNPQDRHATLPPPRVMESVRLEIQTRPPANDHAAVAPKPANTTEVTSDKTGSDKTGIEKLAAKLPPSAETVLPITAAPQAAPTQLSTIVLPSSSAAAPAPEESSQSETTTNGPDAVTAAAKQAKAAHPDKRQAVRHEAGAELRKPAPARFVRGTVTKPNEGM